MPAPWRTAEFWTAILTPIVIAFLPILIAKLPFLSTLTPEQVTAILVGLILAVLGGAFGFLHYRHVRAMLLAAHPWGAK